MTIAFIALGANKTAWHDGRALSPRQCVATALAKIDVLPQSYLLSASGLYVTSPIGPGRQRPYINAVAAIETRLDLNAFNRALQTIETHFHRQRRRAWQARSLDLDVLDYGGDVLPHAAAWRSLAQRPWPNRLPLRSAFLHGARTPTVPHVRLQDRGFVIWPLVELCPNWLHPVYQSTALGLSRRLRRGATRRLGPIFL
ncbi:MAG: 2-amino-4-hydroxy-6-hydroxymethyldihydropteridine diphosphokinase [Pseudomonadota bacterium]